MVNNDLISREVLLKTISDYCADAANYDPDMRKTIEHHCYYAQMLADEVPSVDAVAVVHGRWTFPWTSPECSVCKKTQKWTSKYCPNCGAKMDGDK